ncbi:MAG: dipeptidase [Planctomycetota bacterium]|jgi:dipeptidase
MSKSNVLYIFFAVILSMGLFASSAVGCYAVVVGKDASTDGAVLLGHNEQNYGQRFLNFRKVPRIEHRAGEMIKLQGGAEIPQVKESYAFLWSENPGIAFSDGYLNEWGVAVVSDGCPDKAEQLQKLEAEGRLVKGGIGYMLRRLIAERSKTASEGVRIAGKLIEQVGYPSSRTLIIADPKEAWLLSMSRGRQWVAQRVPDDAVVLLPNVYVIGKVNLKDKANFLASPGLIEYAAKKGWYNPADGREFDFSKAFGQPQRTLMDERQWRGQCLVTGKDIKKTPDRKLPFSVRPKNKLSVKDVISILRYHGEHSLCSFETQEAAVFQLRQKMPVDLGCIYWRCSAEPCISMLTPWYCGITETPKEYYKAVDVKENLTLECHFSESPEKFEPDNRNAWWIFKGLQDKVRADYRDRIGVIRTECDTYEAKVFAAQPKVESRALELYRSDKPAAIRFLTGYSNAVALGAVNKARELTKQFK